MKQHTKWFASALAVASSLVMAGSVCAQGVVLSDFQNFNLSATYGNWDVDGSTVIGGGTGYTPTITSGSTPGSFQVNAQGYGSGAFNFITPIDATGANQFQFSFTINSLSGAGPFWMNVGVDIADGTHLVHLRAQNTEGGYLNYGNVTVGTYTYYGTLIDEFGGAPLDVSTITAFNLELDPAGYGSGAPYDITFNSLSLTTVPEPTTFALAGLGAAGLLIFRRRNK